MNWTRLRSSEGRSDFSRRRSWAAGLAAGVLVLGVAPPASAESLVVVDGDDSVAGVDLMRARVTYAPRQVRVRTVHDNLVRQAIRAQQWITVHVDTDPDDAGPEYRLQGALNRGTDYQLLKVKGWRGGGRTLTCAHRMRIDWKRDVVRVAFGRGCLGEPESVRVALVVGEMSHEGETYKDWLLGPRRWTEELQRG
ncbi:hypothetical protein IEQ44_00615 [Nocardioides sp. Y6]|uniref:Uncharacterized protein n=1 Tax=Nocardioides malaquae TaxID=2773426 RepID=A0ABR9RNJ8_9ACTN|nr:hypothetical protein [Nocardioides malaquae]MBE7323152.1 hypothetical protein [Nocardioides malaquae]